jgi:transaldolase
MAIYLDSANVEKARRAKEFGWVSGVTGNPVRKSWRSSALCKDARTVLGGGHWDQVDDKE